MKFIHIICEGATEKRFVDHILGPHIIELRPHLQVIGHDIGGAISLDKIIDYLVKFCRDPKNDYVTSFADFCDVLNDLPDDIVVPANPPPAEKVAFYENYVLGLCLARLGNNFDTRRLIPHLQLQQFETLLFARPQIIGNELSQQYPFVDAGAFQSIRDQFESCEDINSTDKPSYRIERLVTAPKSTKSAYNKVLDGNQIAKAIGLADMRAACPHFNDWVRKLEEL